MNAWKRDGRKRWSSWDQLSYAALSADERGRLAGKRKELTAEERGRRRWNQILGVMALVVVIGGLATFGIIYGRATIDGAVMAAFCVVVVIVTVTPTMGDGRVLLRLRRERVEEAERLAARRTDVSHDPELAKTYAEVVQRRELTASQLRERKGCLAGIVMARAHPASAKCATIAMLSFWGTRPWAEWAEHHFPPLAVLILLSPFVLMGMAAWFYHRARKRLIQAIEGAACPDCGYPLSTIPPRVPPPEGLAGTIGPERCPECGCPWPLVPPGRGDRVLRVE